MDCGCHPHLAASSLDVKQFFGLGTIFFGFRLILFPDLKRIAVLRWFKIVLLNDCR